MTMSSKRRKRIKKKKRRAKRALNRHLNRLERELMNEDPYLTGTVRLAPTQLWPGVWPPSRPTSIATTVLKVPSGGRT